MDKQHAGATKTERWNIQGNQQYNTGHSKFKKACWIQITLALSPNTDPRLKNSDSCLLN